MEAAGDFEDSEEEDADFDAGGADLDDESDDFSGSDEDDAEVPVPSCAAQKHVGHEALCEEYWPRLFASAEHLWRSCV